MVHQQTTAPSVRWLFFCCENSQKCRWKENSLRGGLACFMNERRGLEPERAIFAGRKREKPASKRMNGFTNSP